MQCPLRSTKQSVGSGYASLEEDNLDRLDDGNGIEVTLKAHKAGWHKKCRLWFNKKAFDEQSRRELATEEQQSASTMQTRSAHSYPQSTELTCFFCNEPAGSASLHTYNIDANVRRCAVEVEDTALLAKLAAGDMIVIDAMYHHNCLFSLYNRAIARQAAPKDDDGDDSCLHGIAFAELVAFLEDMKSDEDSAPATEDEYAWLSKVKTALENSTIDGWISWSAYHADMQQAIIPPPAINALLPLFLDNAHSVAMIQHSMDVIKAAIQDLNPGQTPVLAADQPL